MLDLCLYFSFYQYVQVITIQRQTYLSNLTNRTLKSINFYQIACLSHFSLRRRASSLDFLPEAVGAPKSLTQNGHTNNNNKNSSPFARTTSMSQRSPFRKKIAYPDSADNSITGMRNL